MKFVEFCVYLLTAIAALCFGFVIGYGQGTYDADKLGPRAACEASAFSLYDCSQFKE